ncbi:MAG TPA: hypothetical protein VJP89_11260 [Pyrinomonadaceae bacterium]|nr:hypothetical protein [Pyrinomonadaceae bacterium]
MRSHRANISAVIVLAGALGATIIYLPRVATANHFVSTASDPAPSPSPQSQSTPNRQVRITETDVENNDLRKNGIDVAQPKIYDDALLQQMLRTAEARLAALEVVNQPAILARLGSVTGATQQTSSFGLNIQGPSVPGVTTTTRLPTETITDSSQTTAEGATSTSLQTVSGLAARDEVTTRAGFSPPPAVAPAPTTTLPSAFSVSASDILNEQMQLTAEINGLRLLLSGSLTDYFMQHRPGQTSAEPELPKLRTTLGFHVSLTPDRRYKDAVAIVEVEVGIRDLIERDFRRTLKKFPDKCPGDDAQIEKCIQETVARRMAQRGLPAVTAIIPREKTYNVAAITDKSTSIGGGVATQILGFSGSWVRGHKTYYLVQDQDTVALSYRPIDGDKIGFRWQFRPVLGQHYVKAGLKQTFVQLAFPTLEDASDGEIGSVAVRTYWRKYDRNAGVVKEIIPHSLNEMYRDIDIPKFKQPVMPINVNLADHIEDLGGGQILVKLEGRYLPGTYVRIGATPLTEGPRFKQEYRNIKFTAPISELATKRVFLVAHDGTEKELTLTTSPCERENAQKQKIVDEIKIGELTVTPVDATTSRLKVSITPQRLAPDSALGAGRLRTLLFVIGQRVFGDADTPLQREEDPETHAISLSALVPNTVFAPDAKLVVKPLFAKSDCTSNALDLSESKPAGPERIVPLEQGASEIRFLLIGNKLNELRIISPAGGRFEEIPNVKPAEANKMRVLVLSPADLKTHKQVLLQRNTGRPFLLTIPEFDPKPPAAPKALGTIPIKGDEVIITGEGLTDVESISFRETPVTTFKIVNDQTLRLSGLSALELTSRAGTQRIFIKFKTGRTAEVDIRVVDNIVDTKP